MAGVIRILKRILFTTMKIAGALVLGVVIFVFTFAAFFFATPEFTLPTSQLRKLITQYAPESVDVAFADLRVVVERPSGLWFSKRITINAHQFCARYEREAVSACFDEVGLGLTAGWSGKDDPRPWYIPGLISIDPIRLTKGSVNVDITRFPPSEEPKPEKSSFDTVNFLRTEILPKWHLDGSLVELDPLSIVTAEDAGFDAQFTLTTGEGGDTLRAALKEFSMRGSPLKAQASIRLTRPEDWSESPTPEGQPEVKHAWKLWLDGDVNVDTKRAVKVLADSSIYDWKTLDFRVATKLKGIAALKEARLEGNLKQPMLSSQFSLKMGASGASIQAVDFANCALNANLDQKLASLRCGPQTVRLAFKEQSLVRDPKLYVIQPEFEIAATKLNFGDNKKADFTVSLKINHHGFASLETNLKGEVRKEGESPLRYAVEGDSLLMIPKLHRIAALFEQTPYELPAPLNQLRGHVSFTTNLAMNEQGGAVDYQLATLLDSKNQSVHLRLDGRTDLRPVAGSFKPATRAELAIDALKVSAPRFDLLNKPPRFNPDSRFGPIARGAFEDPPKIPKKPAEEPMDLQVRVYTTAPDAIQIATNVTKAPIPIALDVTYDQVRAKAEREDLPPAPGRGPASLETRTSKSGSGAEIRIANESKRQAGTTGWVSVGETPVELFRREATVRNVRVDLLPNGTQKLNGTVNVSYADYDINVLLLGTTAQPTVKFESEPPLSENHILAVLLYGRAPNELSVDEESSVGSTRAAMANATLGISSLYLLASTPIESVGYDPERDVVTAKVGLGGGASFEVGGGSGKAAAGFNKRISKNVTFRSEVESMGASGQRVISALVEWVKRF